MDLIRTSLDSALFGTRFLPLLLIVVCVCQVAFLGPAGTHFFTFSPRLIVEHGQLWRLITATFVHDNFFQLARNVAVFIVITIAYKLTFETVAGTLSFCYHFILVSVFSGIIHIMIAYVLSFAGFVSEVESHTFGFCRVLLVFFSIDVQLNDYDDRVLTKSDLLGRWAHFVLTIAAIIHDGNWHVGIDFAILMLILFAIESVMNPLPMTYRSVMIGAVSSVVHILIGCVLSRAGFESPALGLCHFLLVFFLVEVQLMGGMRRFFCPDITIPHHWVSFVLMDTLRTPGPWFVGYLSGIITGVLYWFRVLSYFAPSAQFFRRVEKRLFGDSLNRWMYVPAGDERGPVELEDELYSPERFGVFSCSFARKPDSSRPVCFRRQICCSGEVVHVSKLKYSVCLASICIPSSIEIIGPSSIRALDYRPGVIAIAFEWGSKLRQMDKYSFWHAYGIRSFCVPASLATFGSSHFVFSRSLSTLFFEAGSRLRRLQGPLHGPAVSLFVMLPASLTYIDGDRFFRHETDAHVTYAVEAGNRHFTVANGAIMNFARTSVIRHFDETTIATLESMVEELGPFSFAQLPIPSFRFAEPSRLRSIGRYAFTECSRLGSITIPSTVEVIEKGAFRDCRALQEVRIPPGSHLRLIGKLAFDGCKHIQPIDVPWAAWIRGAFKVIAIVYDEDGSKRQRVQFITAVKMYG